MSFDEKIFYEMSVTRCPYDERNTMTDLQQAPTIDVDTYGIRFQGRR